MAVQPVFGLGLDASLPSSISSLSLTGHSTSNMSSGDTAVGSMSTSYATTPIARGSMDSNMPSTSSGLPYNPSPRHSIGGTPRHSFQHGNIASAEEGTLRALCELDCGFPLLMDRTKQSMASCRETSLFLRKRAAIEEEYGRALQKISKERIDAYRSSEGKPGSFQAAFSKILTTHEILGDHRIKAASQLSEMADQLTELARETERQRKLSKDLGARYERTLVDAESQADKCRGRFDIAVEELERVLLAKAGENAKDAMNLPHEASSNVSKARTLGKAMSKLKGGPKNPAQAQRMEEEARLKMNLTSDAYRQQVLATQQIRQEYFNLQLPKVLKVMKEGLDEIDLGTQYHLSRYAFTVENLLVNDGLQILSSDKLDESVRKQEGLRFLVEKIDNASDFRSFMQNYAVTFAASGQKILRREGPPEEGFVRLARVGGGIAGTSATSPAVNGNKDLTPGQNTSGTSPLIPSSSFITPQTPLTAPSPSYFGVPLEHQMLRDNVDIPKVVEKCTEVIEAYGLNITGIYRLSGTTSRIQRLKAKLEKDIDSVDLRSDENLTDINDITGVLKLFFRELPEPLFTYELYHGFIEAAKIENNRLRHIRLHERINDLPDSNYATCKFFLGHLDKVQERESVNSMTKSNLSIVFGPTLLGPPPEDASAVLQDMQWQCKAIETILDHYAEIFIDADEETASRGARTPGIQQMPSDLSPTQREQPLAGS